MDPTHGFQGRPTLCGYEALPTAVQSCEHLVYSFNNVTVGKLLLLLVSPFPLL
jgi:hypothetical protein